MFGPTLTEFPTTVPCHRIAGWNHLAIWVFVDTIDAACVAEAAAFWQQKEAQDGLASLAVIHRRVLRAPSAAFRSQVAQLMATTPMQAQASVALADGFLGASVRAVLGGITLLRRARLPYPDRVFASVDDALAFLDDKAGIGGRHEDAAAAVETLLQRRPATPL